MSASLESRALGALTGLALGDALGMPTQALPRDLVRERWGAVLETFHAGPADNEISAGMRAGAVTDDTDQALILGHLLVAGDGTVDQQRLADELLVWQKMMDAAGSGDLLGPSTVRALGLVAAGADPEVTGRWGDTNGAAMRIAPVGVATPARPLERLVTLVHRSGRVTHNTRIAVAGAAAVAAAVSAALDGADVAEATDLAIEAAHLGAELGHYTGGADVAARISWALDVVREHALEPGLEAIVDLVGTGVVTQEAVPASFAVLALTPDDPWLTVRAAASLGGDSDTIAAMAGAIAGAVHGVEAFPADAVALLEAVNPDLGLAELVSDLLVLRARP
ncbi:ADP-ribosylglycohydrolase [Serinibacter arcticus]|uniref:ADP-ribosylglycohydrolase n=1 Tax=Serinibacter arcticus TaxID=1655435 RepID=A0A2U1ZUW2_9MICO|nr:ADP-ribosylglycohydrolase family protein [Serinibacter arcticus]PWD50776.1 ADP-ribosylglycohydrolase [Serinibacter arcticus]